MKGPEAVGIGFPPVACAAGVEELGCGRDSLAGAEIASHPSCCILHGRTVSWGIVPAPGEFGATPSLVLLPSALGQVAWDESDG